jgi:NAD(P)H-hydrate epimerase
MIRFSVKAVKEIDEYTIINEPNTSIDLVERASTLFVHEFTGVFETAPNHGICRQGNNGADALGIAAFYAKNHIK